MVDEKKSVLETERYVSGLMLELGVPAHLRGYYYLREAVLLSVADKRLKYIINKCSTKDKRK